MTHTKALCGALTFIALANSAMAETHAKKTFLSPRPHGVNTAMEYTTWSQHPYQQHGPSIRSHVQATAFYQHSENSHDVSKYFGIGNGKTSFTVGNAEAVMAKTADIDGAYLIHTSDKSSPLAGTVSFDPEQESFGVRMDWFQYLTHPCKKLFFKASAPVVYVKTTMDMDIDKSASATPDEGAGEEAIAYSLKDFFKGKVNVEAGANQQSSLAHTKISHSLSKVGVADLDLSLGYRFFQNDKKHVFLSLDVTVPTGNKVHTNNLFEPIYGNGRHVGLGGSIDAGIQFWKNKHAQLRLLGTAHYKYLFENTEHRTLGIKNMTMGHYYLAGEVNQINKPLFPAANILTMPVCVKPGNQLDALIDLVFATNKFTIDIGYNFFWRDTESAWIKCFKDGTYAIAYTNYDTTTVFDEYSGYNTTLTKADLDTNAITTPTLLTHKIFAGIGYTMQMCKKYPTSFALGCSYEFASSNADIEDYAVWGKLIFSF